MEEDVVKFKESMGFETELYSKDSDSNVEKVLGIKGRGLFDKIKYNDIADYYLKGCNYDEY